MATKDYLYKTVLFTDKERELLRKIEKCFVEILSEDYNCADAKLILEKVREMYPGPQNILQAYEQAREAHNNELWFDHNAFVKAVLNVADKQVYTSLVKTLHLDANGYQSITTGGGIDI